MRYRFVARRISKHKTFLMIMVGLLLAYIITQTPQFYSIINGIGSFRLLGAFIAGFFFSSALTTAPSMAVIYFLSANYPPYLVALFGALGAMIADINLYRYVVSGVVDEIEHDFKFVAKLEKYRNRKYYKQLIPIVGGIIIASPLPDELGIAIFGYKKMNLRRFLIYSFVFNFIGIFIIASLA